MRNKFLYPQLTQPAAAGVPGSRSPVPQPAPTLIKSPRRQRSRFLSAGLLAFAAAAISLSNPGCTRQDAQAQAAQSLTLEQRSIIRKMTSQLARRVGVIGKPDEAMLAQAMLFHKEVFLGDDSSSHEGVVDTIRLVFSSQLTPHEQESIKAWLRSTE